MRNDRTCKAALCVNYIHHWPWNAARKLMCGADRPVGRCTAAESMAGAASPHVSVGWHGKCLQKVLQCASTYEMAKGT